MSKQYPVCLTCGVELEYPLLHPCDDCDDGTCDDCAKFVGTDKDGTKWVKVRFTIEVEVMADEADDDAIELARLALPDYISAPAYKMNPEFVEMR